MTAESDDILTLSELADYLKVAEKSVLRMVRSGELPGAKVASQWRFMRAVVDDWLMARMRSASKAGLFELVGKAGTPVRLSRLLDDSSILLEVVPGAKEAVLRQLIAPLVHSRAIPDGDAFLAGLLDREAIVSTAVGGGLAFPHMRDPEDSPVARPSLVLGVCRQGTDFDAVDHARTHVFVLVAVTSAVVHLKVMAELAIVFRDPAVGLAVQRANTPAAIRQLLIAREQQFLVPVP